MQIVNLIKTATVSVDRPVSPMIQYILMGVFKVSVERLSWLRYVAVVAKRATRLSKGAGS